MTALTEADVCPKFHTCNAAVCPLEPRLAAHLCGEPVCFYLRVSGKAGSAERYGDDPVFSKCVARLPEIAERWPDIRRRVEIAARCGFRRSNLPRPVTHASEKAVCSALCER